MINTRRRFVLMSTLACAVFPLQVRAADDDDDTLQNVFISPAGKPFRAPMGAPYPVVQWFKEADRNQDGKIDRTEFRADCAAFFDGIDANKDGYLSPIEVELYERRVAPEILGYRVKIGQLLQEGRDGARLWRTQAGRPSTQSIDPGGGSSSDVFASKPTVDESKQGAGPFGFFDEPEPITAADLDFRGVISKANFMKLADIHFKTLDRDDEGFLTLAKLPKTPMQKRLERKKRGFFHLPG